MLGATPGAAGTWDSEVGATPAGAAAGTRAGSPRTADRRRTPAARGGAAGEVAGDRAVAGAAHRHQPRSRQLGRGGASGLQRSAHVAGAVEQQCGHWGQRAGPRPAGGPARARTRTARRSRSPARSARRRGRTSRHRARPLRLPSLGLARADRGGWRPGKAALGAGRGQQQGNAERARIGGQLDRVGDLLEAEQRPGVALPGRAQRRGELGISATGPRSPVIIRRQQPRAVDPQGPCCPPSEADREAEQRPALADLGHQPRADLPPGRG